MAELVALIDISGVGTQTENFDLPGPGDLTINYEFEDGPGGNSARAFLTHENDGEIWAEGDDDISGTDELTGVSAGGYTLEAESDHGRTSAFVEIHYEAGEVPPEHFEEILDISSVNEASLEDDFEAAPEHYTEELSVGAGSYIEIEDLFQKAPENYTEKLTVGNTADIKVAEEYKIGEFILAGAVGSIEFIDDAHYSSVLFAGARLYIDLEEKAVSNYAVWRRVEGGEWEIIGLTAEIEFVDENVGEKSYEYRIKRDNNRSNISKITVTETEGENYEEFLSVGGGMKVLQAESLKVTDGLFIIQAAQVDLADILSAGEILEVTAGVEIDKFVKLTLREILNIGLSGDVSSPTYKSALEVLRSGANGRVVFDDNIVLATMEEILFVGGSVKVSREENLKVTDELFINQTARADLSGILSGKEIVEIEGLIKTAELSRAGMSSRVLIKGSAASGLSDILSAGEVLEVTAGVGIDKFVKLTSREVLNVGGSQEVIKITQVGMKEPVKIRSPGRADLHEALLTFEGLNISVLGDIEVKSAKSSAVIVEVSHGAGVLVSSTRYTADALTVGLKTGLNITDRKDMGEESLIKAPGSAGLKDKAGEVDILSVGNSHSIDLHEFISSALSESLLVEVKSNINIVDTKSAGEGLKVLGSAVVFQRDDFKLSEIINIEDITAAALKDLSALKDKILIDSLSGVSSKDFAGAVERRPVSFDLKVGLADKRKANEGIKVSGPAAINSISKVSAFDLITAGSALKVGANDTAAFKEKIMAEGLTGADITDIFMRAILEDLFIEAAFEGGIADRTLLAERLEIAGAFLVRPAARMSMFELMGAGPVLKPGLKDTAAFGENISVRGLNRVFLSDIITSSLLEEIIIGSGIKVNRSDIMTAGDSLEVKSPGLLVFNDRKSAGVSLNVGQNISISLEDFIRTAIAELLKVKMGQKAGMESDIGLFEGLSINWPARIACIDRKSMKCSLLISKGVQKASVDDIRRVREGLKAGVSIGPEIADILGWHENIASKTGIKVNLDAFYFMIDNLEVVKVSGLDIKDILAAGESLETGQPVKIILEGILTAPFLPVRIELTVKERGLDMEVYERKTGLEITERPVVTDLFERKTGLDIFERIVEVEVR
ncbi:hypothetical protein [Halarsenatibacter silvermanii]|uniref:Uncharacterized protein n=1 Tax=Halarsenatibacter silvermanii TaxID=321763 RepID=A0A1G9RC72_9FIRM|nr:hypothetical protein [Halarsenatibacter silvermanii]SDM20818.1 hypothetical protein SAMN04488692_12134 [Halarsenatibacter silvermanii]